MFREEFEKVINILMEKSSAKQIKGNYTSFCPYLQFITLDALETEDYPNGINQNSIFLTFVIDFREHKVELHHQGHIWLSPSDKETPRYRYYAMKSMVNCHVDFGGKKFRKSKFKNAEDLAAKMEKYYKEVMKSVVKYTNGYPYKQGV